jgi:glutaredoxin
MSTNLKKIYSKINNDTDYIVFGLSYCIFCKKTIEFLQKNNISHKYYLIDDYKEIFMTNFVKLEKEYQSLNINSLHNTVPIIFYKKKFIGGYTDLIGKFNK